MKAYPFIHKHPTTGNTKLEEGMDLRDYFAAQAIIAYHADGNFSDSEDVANWCYRLADAMLSAREVKNDQP